MKVPFVYGPGDLRLDDIAEPVAGARDVVVRVASIGVCGSDLGYVAMGGVAGPTGTPIPLGHELSGTIVEAGAEVRDWFVGDRVAINPLINAIGNGGPEGGFAERLLVRDVVGLPQSLLRIPAGMSFDTAALAEPLAVSMHGINQSGAKPGDKVAIFGAGPIGLGAVALLRHRGIEDVVVFDLSPFRRARAEALGAAAAIDPRAEEPRAALGRLHGTGNLWGMETVGTTHFIDMAGAPGVVEAVVAMAPFGARLTVTAIQKKPVTLDFQTLLAKEMTINTSMAYPTEMPDAVDLLASGFDVEGMVSHRFSGNDVLAAFDAAQHAESAAKVLVQYAR